MLMTKATIKQVTMTEKTFKKVNTVAQLISTLQSLPKEAMNDRITMYSDEEGNSENKILCVEWHDEGVTLIPWEQWEND
jgi:hypothetical protein